MDKIDRSRLVKYLVIGSGLLFGAFVLYRSLRGLVGRLQDGPVRNSISRMVQKSSSAALVKLTTSHVFLVDGGLRFCVSVLNAANPKPEREEQTTDPFLYPFESGVHICDLNEDYRLLFNKYYVCDGHVLIVTKRFEEQNKLLTRRDFDVTLTVMQELKALAYYNSGPESGFSQQHKHIQVLPLDALPQAPWREVIEVREEGMFTLPQFNFRHCFYHFTPGFGPDALFHVYQQMLKLLDITPERDSYNLVMTSHWMLVVLREKAMAYNRIPVNALGFIGLLLVKTKEDLELVQKTGPLSVIRDAACRL